MDEVHEQTTAPPAPDIKQNWADSIKRIIRRKEIAKNLGASTSFSEISQKVREFEQTNDVNQLVENLLTAEVIVEPKRAVIGTELANQLRQRYPESNIGAVLVGSSAHGGAELRRLVENEEDSKADIDWMITYTYKQGIILPFKEIAAFGKLIIEESVKRAGLPETLKACPQIDAEAYHTENLADTTDAVNRLKLARDFQDFEDLTLFFLPSYPPEINQQNRQLLLRGLSALAKKNPNLWRKKVKELNHWWKYQHSIKEKHLVSKYSTPKDKEMAIFVENFADQVMPLAMSALLNSTRNL